MVLFALFIIYVFIFPNKQEPLAPPEKPYIPEETQQTEISQKKEYRNVDSFGCPKDTEYEFEEIRKHISCSLREPEKNDLWLLIDGHVYNVTDWIIRHPGGEFICRGAGIDASKLFARFHSDHVRQRHLPLWCIGQFVPKKEAKTDIYK